MTLSNGETVIRELQPDSWREMRADVSGCLSWRPFLFWVSRWLLAGLHSGFSYCPENWRSYIQLDSQSYAQIAYSNTLSSSFFKMWMWTKLLQLDWMKYTLQWCVNTSFNKCLCFCLVVTDQELMQLHFVWTHGSGMKVMPGLQHYSCFKDRWW